MTAESPVPAEGIVFGPVPSRRLGRSLGVNNVIPKTCSYSCVYCQVGRTHCMAAVRRPFYGADAVVQAVQQKVAQAAAARQTIDYITFVPDGEPALDIHLGAELERLQPLGYPLAVITNSSLIGLPDVQADLSRAAWVSLKIDTVSEAVWRRVDRPHALLSLPAILGGAREFAATFSGRLVTETMLVAGVNDDPATLRATRDYIGELRPVTAYIAVPTRPPAEEWVRPPSEDAITAAYHLFKEVVPHVELLIGHEGNAFSSTGNLEADLLAITAVHPMRVDAVELMLIAAGADLTVVDRLCKQGLLRRLAYMGETYFARTLPARPLFPS